MRSFSRLAASSLLVVALSLATVDAALAERAAPIAFVPLDDRPVTLQLPVMLGAIAGQPVLTPPHATVGHFLTPGDPEAILQWLRSPATAGVSALVASIDMIAYGGLVASRAPGPSRELSIARLRALGDFKRARPGTFVGAFGTVMRLAPTGVPTISATRDVWATGETADRIAAYANLPDPPQTDEQRAYAARLRELVGAQTLDTYLATRARDLAVDEVALDLTAEGDFDRLVLGQDDAGPTGLHRRDLAALDARARGLDIGERVSIEPGADELGMVLLARVFARDVGWIPSVRVRYSRAGGSGVVDPLEYVPIDVTISRLILACGATRTSESADIELFVRVPATAPSDEGSFEEALAQAAATGRHVAVADLSFLDGNPGPQQRELTEALIERGLAGKIDAFASWNTNANTIGTALATTIAAGAGRRARRLDPLAHAEFLLDRYIDDYAFHQFVRPELNEQVRAQGIDAALLLGEVAAQAGSRNRALLWPRALDLLAAVYPQYRDAGMTMTLPWDRTFETRIDVRLVTR